MNAYLLKEAKDKKRKIEMILEKLSIWDIIRMAYNGHTLPLTFCVQYS